MTIAEDESTARGLRRSIKWGLAATLVATVAALYWSAPPIVEVRADLAAADGPAARSRPDTRVDRQGTAIAPAPAFGEFASTFPANAFDPFAGATVSAPVAPPPPAASVPAAPPPPPPPVQDYRFLGRVVGPDGSLQILLGSGDKAVAVAKGTVLDNGYLVDSITKDAVGLVFAPLDVRTSISIPAE